MIFYRKFCQKCIARDDEMARNLEKIRSGLGAAGVTASVAEEAISSTSAMKLSALGGPVGAVLVGALALGAFYLAYKFLDKKS